MNDIKTIALRTLLPAAVIVLTVLTVMTPSGCHSVSEGLNFIEGDYSSPQIKSFSVTSSSSAEIAFTKEVVSLETGIFKKVNPEENFTASCFFDTETNTALLDFSEDTVTGCPYVMEGCAKDRSGNSVTFSIPFTGWNEKPAHLLLSEIRNAYGTVKVDGNSFHKTEFAELYVLKEGNLSGIELYSLCDGEEKKYTFPAINVKKGEYITVHMRKLENSTSCPYDAEGVFDEKEENLNLASRLDSNPKARDLWFDNKKPVFADSDIIMIKDGLKIYDCLYYAKSSFEGFKENNAELADKILNENLWIGEPLSSDEITTSGTKKSISRQNLDKIIKGEKCENTKEVWAVTVDSGSGKNKVTAVTPGYENYKIDYQAE